MAKKVCINCKLFVIGSQCPICKGTKFSDNWKGRIIIIDPNNSEIAKKVGITVKGEYAIKIR